MLLLWSVPVLYVIHGALPFNPIALPMQNRAICNALAPQGWRFFTKDVANEDEVHGYRLDRAVWKLDFESATLRRHLFSGANREMRLYPAEVARLASAIRESEWSSCDDRPERCLAGLQSVLEISFMTPLTRLCTTIGHGCPLSEIMIDLDQLRARAQRPARAWEAMMGANCLRCAGERDLVSAWQRVAV